jgi:hypothetical protein
LNSNASRALATMNLTSGKFEVRAASNWARYLGETSPSCDARRPDLAMASCVRSA